MLEDLPCCLADTRILVIGHGRIGRILTTELRALGASVCVASRRAVIGEEWVQTGDFGSVLTECDAVVNTAPALVLNAVELQRLRPDCLVLDLASAPGGVDMAAARAIGRKVRWELSLPGRMFPRSAGRIIKDTVQRVLNENMMQAGGTVSGN